MKLIVTILTLGLCLLGIPLYATATTQLELDSVTISQGGTGTLNLKFSGGTEPYAGVNARVVLPEGIKVKGVSSSTGFITDFNLSGKEVTVIAYSGTNTVSTSGILLNLSLEADSTTTAGTYPVSFATTNSNSLINSKYALSNSDGSESVEPVIIAGKITISQASSEDTDKDGLADEWEKQYFGNLNQNGTGDYDSDGITNAQEYANGTDPTIKHGDLNGDKNVNLADAVIGLKIICAMNPGIFKIGADINGDAKIGLEEIVFIIQKVAEFPE